jgi:hypothetical protein
MKALTICQPYADMIATGEKIIENRTWPTSYRGPIAIHAGKSRAWMDECDASDRPSMAFGAVVATAELYECVRWERLSDELKERHDASGPWCWMLRNVRRIDPPVPQSGAQGLWEWTTQAASGRSQEPGAR